ncbi:hypothetical protein K9U39_00950 [Rhodoblastus acidophilus]|uniref:Chemotaxis protein n=1 Tax=Candidatus Rhodoblastus alkanivorans TaxID=2954117 RepID=A0ABS9Z3H9_9HYPH|nr:hypothetical protein [Candidatus Rhodoblastus alkanivorans]MCI4678837.1 hypothetical protein [Candidatus Rhodoblastus alkanivorans]MCI4682226.1 hypothetical protein [Candidatus Rhodoblastus alkanivorans]MDI4639528.1 hypothetical protein [Rhodoblastus acidophilus]
MKFALPKLPRMTLKAPSLRLPAWRGLSPPRLKFALPAGKSKRTNLLIAGGALGVLALGGVGWFVVWPRLRPQASVAAPPKDAAGPAAPAKTEAEPEARTEAKQETKPEPKIAASPAAQASAAPPHEQESKAQAIAALSAPPAPPSEAERLVRQLQDVENRVAAGDAASYQETPKLVRAIARRYIALPPQTWAEKRNARALVLYLLSGGNSALGRRILNERTLAPSEEPLAKGAVAYLEGIDCAERDALLDVDPRQLDVALGAQVAFVQSILLSNYDRDKAIGKLDLARLLAPGGLVEEAALRREAGLLSETENFDKFAELARQYRSRFRRSPYAANFLRQFRVAVERVSVRITVQQWAPLDEFMESLGVEKRRGFYLVMARTAAVAGNSAFADLAASRALALAAPDSVERERALLYRAAAEVLSPDATANANLLRGVDRGKLMAGDRPLYDAVAMTSARIFRAPEMSFVTPPPGAGDLPGGELARAESSLREANAAVEAARRSMERKSR